MRKSPPRPKKKKRPAATIDVKATEIKKDEPAENSASDTSTASTGSNPSSKDKPDNTASSASKNEKSQSRKSSSSAPKSERKSRERADNGRSDNERSGSGRSGKPPSGKTPKPATAKSGGGGFVSHLLASGLGAVLGIFGLTFAHNQELLPSAFQLSNGKAVKQQVSTLAAQISRLEEQTPKGANSLENRLAVLAKRLDKTQASLGGQEPGSKSLAEKVSNMESFIGNLEKASKTGKGGRIAGLAAATTQLKKSNQQTLLLSNEFVKLREQQNSFREDLADIRSSQADFQTSTSKISDDMAKLRNVNAVIVAAARRPPDVSDQINPVLAQLKDLTTKIDDVRSREQSSKDEGRKIGLALTLGALKRAVNSGNPYELELAELLPNAPKSLDLGILRDHARKGLVTRKALRRSFTSMSHNALASENTAASGSLMDQLLANAKSMVQVRPTGLVEGETTDAILSRMEYKFDQGDLSGSLKESEALQGPAKDVLQPWLKQAGLRLAGDETLRALEGKIRNSLSGTPTQ